LEKERRRSLLEPKKLDQKRKKKTLNKGGGSRGKKLSGTNDKKGA